MANPIHVTVEGQELVGLIQSLFSNKANDAREEDRRLEKAQTILKKLPTRHEPIIRITTKVEGRLAHTSITPTQLLAARFAIVELPISHERFDFQLQLPSNHLECEQGERLSLTRHPSTLFNVNSCTELRVTKEQPKPFRRLRRIATAVRARLEDRRIYKELIPN